MLRPSPLHFLLPGSAARGCGNSTYRELAERADGERERERERGLMAANENWRAMSTRECRRAVRSGTRGTRGDRLVSGFRDSSMIKAAHGSVNSGMFNLLKAMSRLRAFVCPRSFRARRPRLTVEYFSVQRKEREKERERERERERGGGS